jgi:diguanylate cyclase (GGDEF)-like protein
MAFFLDFFTRGHDVRFVALAALICLVAAYACVTLLRHAGRVHGRIKLAWIAVASLSVGFGIWATHFVAMLAFQPGFELHYDIGLTAISLLLAIVICGAGLTLSILGNGLRDNLLGGAVVGVGISSMHYMGIFALVMGGNLQWNGAAVGLSVIAGIILSAVAMAIAGSGFKHRNTFGALVLTLAICVMHFTAMAAADFSNCFPTIANGSQAESGLMAFVVAFISLLLLAAAFGSAILDEADRRRTEREKDRQLADAMRSAEVSDKLELALTHMGQGLALFGADGKVELSNSRFVALLGLAPSTDVIGSDLNEICRLAVKVHAEPGLDIEKAAKDFAASHLRVINGGGGEKMQNIGREHIFRIKHTLIANGGWVTTIEDVTESKRKEAAIAHLARHDTMTNLPNRANFEEQFDVALEAADQGDDNLAVIAFDLDRFKEINDTFGHEAGDEVLRLVASRLTDCLRDGEVVARVGGDEFAALKPFTSMDSLRDFLARLEAAVTTRVTYVDAVLNIAGSIGVAIFPDDGADRSKLLNNADLAMYRAKSEFDQRVCYYEREMDEHARQRRAMAADIWQALETDAFTLAYQVQKSVSTQEITGYEVLLRWDRPGFGPVSPADFIPVAEECGAIGAIGNWVLKTACAEAASWPEPHKIAVNVSGLQLGQLELVDMVKMVLFQSGLDPSRLELEVTETAIISDKRRALHILRQIKALGVSIAIDDFGTGYSSLETLRSFPFDKIKLDRSFMDQVETNEQSKAIIRAILALGRSLHVPVLAEGVETTAQLDVLRLEGCNEAQGYLLGRPGRIDWDDLIDLPMRA